jgi:glycosyltransferase involved in cell wall biosynthesis
MNAVTKNPSNPLLVQVSQHYRPIGGGQEVYIANLAQVLHGVGWMTRVIQPFRGEKASDTALVPRIPGIARYFPSFDELQFALFTVAVRWSLLNRADVILCHYAATAAVIGRMRRWRAKTIVLSHGVEWNVDRMNLYDRVREYNARRLFSRVMTVANDTDYLRRMGMTLAPRSCFFSEVTPGVWFVPNCVDPHRFSPAGALAARNRKETVILVPRQICEDRGIHLAIDAFAILAPRYPDVRLDIVGHPREKEYFKKCQDRVISHGLEGRILFREPVPNEKMPDLYRDADVTLIPTVRREGTSLSALESMACGVPVVASDVAGLRDLPATLCPATPAALAEGLEAVMASRGEVGGRQRNAVCEDFNYEIWAASWRRIIRKFQDRGSK